MARVTHRAVTEARRQGTIIGAEITLQPNANELDITLNLSGPDLADESLEGNMAIEVSYDDGLNWLTVARTPWQGGSPKRGGGFAQPTLSINMGDIRPGKARPRVSTARNIIYSCDLAEDVVEPDTNLALSV